MPFVPSSFLLLVVRPGAPSSVLAPTFGCGNLDGTSADRADFGLVSSGEAPAHRLLPTTKAGKAT